MLAAWLGSARAQAPQDYDQLLAKANAVADTSCADAEAWYARAIAARPGGLEALVGSGMCLVERKKFASAHSRFRSALAVDARYEGALWGVAEALRLQGKRDEAVAAYRDYLAVYPSSYKAKAALDKLGGGAPAPAPAPARGTGPSIEIQGTAIAINGLSLSSTPMVADVVALLGPWTRVWDKPSAVNKIYTWDSLGIIAYEPKDGRCISLTMPFVPMNMDYDPTTMFGGSITVDGQPIHKQTTLTMLKARAGATQPYSGTSVVFPKGEFNVFTLGKADGAVVDLVEVSMWKKTTAKATAPAAKSGAQIRVSGTSVTMNGTAIPGHPMLADIEAVFGKADRVWDSGSGNRVHTWDAHGLVAYEPRDGRVISTTFPFRSLSSSYDPKAFFAGTIEVDGEALGAQHDIAQIKARPGATQPYSATSVVFDRGDIHVFTRGGTGGTLDLVEISYWQKKTGKDAAPAAPAPTPVANVVVSGTRVTMNGTAISGTPMVSDLEAVFGKADRVWDKPGAVNRIHTWDKLGLVVYEPRNGRCISATFPFRPLGGDFDPQARAVGSITVDGTRLGPATTYASVKRMAGVTHPYGADSIVFDKADIHIFTKADGDTSTIDLVEISFWQRDKK